MTVMVDELQVWPHAKHRCFRNGSARDVLVLKPHAFESEPRRERVELVEGVCRQVHYDLSPGKHAAALKLGAVLVPAREQARKRLAAREAKQ